MLFFIRCVYAEEPSKILSGVEQLKENSFSCIFDGVKHKFILDLPEKTEGAPLVVMLPGYGNTAEALRSSSGFEKKAVPLGYAVVYVTGARNPNDKLSSIGWNSGVGIDGNDDTAFLTALAEYLQREYSLDAKRTFAAGFSNGAFMTHRLAMEAGNTFSACVSVAGLMPAKIWNSRNETNDISFFQITGEKDDVVPKRRDGSADHTKDPAIEDVMVYWAASAGLDDCVSEQTENGSELTKCRGGRTANQVWHLVVKNGRHSWPSAEMTGIEANDLILEFFETVSP